MTPETLQAISFLIAGAIVILGALGVVLSKHPVHSALFLIQTLFGVAIEFLVVEAHFLAAIQVIVYAGAIVILFLFVIMLLGVDNAEDLAIEPIVGQRPLALLSGGAIFSLLMAIIFSASSGGRITGGESLTLPLNATDSTGELLPNINQMAQTIFTDQVFAFEVTGFLLTVAVVGAVVMARRIPGAMQPLPDVPPIGSANSRDEDLTEAEGAAAVSSDGSSNVGEDA